MDKRTFAEAAAIINPVPTVVHLDAHVGDKEDCVPWRDVERIISRYAILRTGHRGVALLDIVDFSLASPLEQLAQLHSLENSANTAHRHMQQRGLEFDLARSPTGDGYYLWNREEDYPVDLRTDSLSAGCFKKSASQIGKETATSIGPAMRPVLILRSRCGKMKVH